MLAVLPIVEAALKRNHPRDESGSAPNAVSPKFLDIISTVKNCVRHSRRFWRESRLSNAILDLLRASGSEPRGGDEVYA
jgi:hypothetical protein